MTTNNIFNAAQLQYLVSKCGQNVVDAALVMFTNGHAEVGLSFLATNGLSAGDVAEIRKELASRLPAPAGFPTSGTPGLVAFPGSTPATPATMGPKSLVQQVADILTVTRKDGSTIAKGLAKPYRDNPAAWPTVDAFGRPFPSLQELVGMTKEAAKRHFTNSGFPKCYMDGVAYYVQDKGGHSLFKLAEVAQYQQLLQKQENDKAAAEKRAPQSITVDMKTVPADIAPMSWRWWNGQMGPVARYGAPEHHKLICQMTGVVPVEYEQHVASTAKPAVTAPPAAAPQPAKPATARRRR